MFNGVGLPTPRGSGTSGYVQRSLANLPPVRIAKNHDQHGHITRPKMRVNPEIVMHEKLRSLEVRLMEMRVENEGKVPPEELESMLANERARLMKLLEQDSVAITARENDSNSLAEQKLHQNAKMERALKLTSRKPPPSKGEREDEGNTRSADTYRDARRGHEEHHRRERSYSRSPSSRSEMSYSSESHSRSRSGSRSASSRSRSYSRSPSRDSSYTPSYSSRGSSRSYSRSRTRSYSSSDSYSPRYRGDESHRRRTKEKRRESSSSVDSRKSLERREDKLIKSYRRDYDRRKNDSSRYTERSKYRSMSTSSRSSSDSYSRSRSYSNRRRHRHRSPRRRDSRRDRRSRSRSSSESRRDSDRKRSPMDREEERRRRVSPHRSVQKSPEHALPSANHSDNGRVEDNGALSDSSMEHSDN